MSAMKRPAFQTLLSTSNLKTTAFAGRICSPVLSRRASRVARPSRLPPLCATTRPAAVADGAEADALRKLQNGSDVRGVASDQLGAEVTLTPARVRAIAAAFARDVAARTGAPPRVAIGRDSRMSGPELAEAAAAGVRDAGADPTHFGLATTPAMFMATVLGARPYDAGIMLTASHLPPDRNGAKLFTRAGSASASDIRRVLAAAVLETARAPNNASARAPTPEHDFMAEYAAHLVGLIRTGCAHPSTPDEPLRGLKFVVDAGNGAAGFFATDVLRPLGAEVYGQFLDPDGSFPNHIPNPEDKRAMAMTVESTVRENADLGIIFDTDGDRSGFVDDRGTAINRNRLIAILARIVLREAPGSTVVTDSVTSNGLKRFIEDNGGRHFRYRKGYKNVIDKGIELDASGVETQLAIETSGHGAMKENYMLDDGAYLAVKIIIELVRLRLSGDKRGIGGLLEGLNEPEEEIEFRLSFFDKSDYKAYGTDVIEAFAEFAKTVDGWTPEEENYEGLRVNVDEADGKAGWLLLRQSLHDPLLPLNVESESAGGVADIANVLLKRFFSQWTNVDATPLKECVHTG